MNVRFVTMNEIIGILKFRKRAFNVLKFLIWIMGGADSEGSEEETDKKAALCFIVLNFSNTTLKQYETETLQLGLKFATGPRKKHELLDIVKMNQRLADSDFNRGFIQGLIASTLNQPTHLITDFH